MKLVIGNKNYSSWSLRPWLLMRALEIPFEEELVPLYREDSKSRLLQHAPSGRVPVLHDGELVVWDSLAIIEYLAEQFPGVAVWPRDTEARAHARSVCAEMHSGFTALRSHMPMNCRASLPGEGQTPAVLADIARIGEIWEDCRRRHALEGPYLFGEFSAADAFFAPVVTRFVTYQVPLTELGDEYVETMRGLPALQEWYLAALKETERIEASEPYA